MRFSPSIRSVYLLFIILVFVLIAGCATTENSESEIPWNAPQPWEGNVLHGIMGGQ